MKTRKITFEGHNESLRAKIDLPDDAEPAGWGLFAHCFTCNKNLKAVGNISRSLTEQGFAMFRFDFTGLGESEGDFADTNFSSNIQDLIAATEYLKKEYEAPKILIGHSLGGAAVLQAARYINSCRAVATIGAPCNPGHVAHLLDSKREDIIEKGEAKITLAGRTFSIKKQFLDDLEEARMDDNIKNLKRALLLFHSPVDQTVGVENASHIFKLAKHPKSFISLDEADHLLMNDRDSRFVGKITGSWAQRYLT